MHSLSIIQNIRNEAINSQHDGEDWKAKYCAVVSTANCTAHGGGDGKAASHQRGRTLEIWRTD